MELNGIWIIARTLLATVFLSSGAAKMIDFQGGMSEMRAAGLHPDWLFNIVTALLLLISSLFIILDKALWVGMVALSIFLLLTIVVVHRFWNMPQPDSTQAMFWAVEHVSLVGGLLSAAIASRSRRKLI
ncbi:DoxX family protein [Pluralibacter gergoviae]|uniref:DoxX family protein n=2 Tax=Pluralibacter gergoviae TaxID=61647 RepID=A0A0J5MZG8_PLUGE|nr:DoxX family protein [Pluralibacter gergoviae]EKV0914374.1 DoxX family protein [Pluralibacter gergoviae]EKV0931172.1 DoxX family protein [Pluralibacter gergoviae]EKV6246352.1 DoxX family protein [Pluralibacter gergoviae]EKV9911134.1 DoxX family protein [Pluralibacter gergoviae]EKW7276886.1 DoxX family protein [Pluralibacter gergoviae]